MGSPHMAEKEPRNENYVYFIKNILKSRFFYVPLYP